MAYSTDHHLRTIALTETRYRLLRQAAEQAGVSQAEIIGLALDRLLPRMAARVRATAK